MLIINGYTKIPGIELGDHKIKTTNLLIRELNSTTLTIHDATDSYYRSIQLQDIYFYGKISSYSPSTYIKTHDDATSSLSIQSHDGSQYVTNLKLVGGTVEIYNGKLTSSFNCNLQPLKNVNEIIGSAGNYDFIIKTRRNAANAGDALFIKSFNSSDSDIDRIVITGGVDQADIKILNSRLIPDMASGGSIGIEYYVSDYGGNFASFTPPSGYEGRIIVAIDTNATSPGKRLYVYANGSWNYVDLN